MSNLTTSFNKLKKGEKFASTIDAQNLRDVRAATKLFGAGALIDIHTDVGPENEQGNSLKVVHARFRTKTPGVVKVVIAEKYGGDKKFHRSLPSWDINTAAVTE